MGDGRLENSGVAVWVEPVLVFDSHEVVGGYCGCIHSCRQVALSALSLSIYVHLKSRVGINRFFEYIYIYICNHPGIIYNVFSSLPPLVSSSLKTHAKVGLLGLRLGISKQADLLSIRIQINPRGTASSTTTDDGNTLGYPFSSTLVHLHFAFDPSFSATITLLGFQDRLLGYLGQDALVSQPRYGGRQRASLSSDDCFAVTFASADVNSSLPSSPRNEVPARWR